MYEQVVAWDGYVQLAMPPDWTYLEENGVITIAGPEGIGALQLSFASSDNVSPALKAPTAAVSTSCWRRSGVL